MVYGVGLHSGALGRRIRHGSDLLGAWMSLRGNRLPQLPILLGHQGLWLGLLSCVEFHKF